MDAIQRCPTCGAAVGAGAAACPACGAALQPLTDEHMEAGTLVAGQRLREGDYAVERVLGRGGFGITYLAADVRLRRRVALKEFFPAGATRRGAQVLPPPTFTQADFGEAMERFLAESRVLARFRHPNIVAVHDVFQEQGTAYMVMEYLPGDTLEDVLLRSGGRPLPQADLLRLAARLCDALDLVHAARVLHRDIKPANVILVRGPGEPRPVLIDFGAAREFARGYAARHSVLVTQGYAPLEQYAEQGRRGPFTDVYALAATLYHLATGSQPPAATDRAIGVELRAPRALNPALDEQFSRAILRAMAMRVAERPQTAGAFYAELAGAPPPAPGAPPPGAERPAAPGGRPGPTPNLDRVAAIAGLLTRGGPAQTDRLACPVCRADDLADPGRARGPLDCPVCRATTLRLRVPADAHDACPACRDGRLAHFRPEGLLRCPACRAGMLARHARTRLLLFSADAAACAACGADFDLETEPQPDGTDLITRMRLVALPNGSEHLPPGATGDTRTTEEWIALSGRTNRELRCDTCDAEFDQDERGLRRWISRAGKPAAVPPNLRGTWLPPVDWAKLALGLRLQDGAIACPNCRAQFDEAPEGLLLRGGEQDPVRVLARYRGRTMRLPAWRRLAAGMREPQSPGLLCSACGAELDELDGDAFRLLAAPGQDPHGVAARYDGRELARVDWQRIAAGRQPLADEAGLRAEAAEALWRALRGGEVYPDAAGERSYPAPRSNGERVLLALRTSQLRPVGTLPETYDSGTLWITTHRLFYGGDEGTVIVPYAMVYKAHAAQFGDAPALAVMSWDRKHSVYFTAPDAPFRATIHGLQIEVPLSVERLVELIQARQQTA